MHYVAFFTDALCKSGECCVWCVCVCVCNGLQKLEIVELGSVLLVLEAVLNRLPHLLILVLVTSQVPVDRAIKRYSR